MKLLVNVPILTAINTVVVIASLHVSMLVAVRVVAIFGGQSTGFGPEIYTYLIIMVAIVAALTITMLIGFYYAGRKLISMVSIPNSYKQYYKVSFLLSLIPTAIIVFIYFATTA